MLSPVTSASKRQRPTQRESPQKGGRTFLKQKKEGNFVKPTPLKTAHKTPIVIPTIMAKIWKLQPKVRFLEKLGQNIYNLSLTLVRTSHKGLLSTIEEFSNERNEI